MASDDNGLDETSDLDDEGAAAGRGRGDGGGDGREPGRDDDAYLERAFAEFATVLRPWRPGDEVPPGGGARWRRRSVRVPGGEPSWAVDHFPPARRLRVFTFDPSAERGEGAVATARVPFEPLRPGPEGRLFKVVDDNDAGAGSAPRGAGLDARRKRGALLDLDHPSELASDGRTPSLGDRSFHRQMVYAVAMRTWHIFREALGRDPVWGFQRRAADDAGAGAGAGDKGGDPFGPFRLRLRLLSDGKVEANAWYDPEQGEIAFGSFPADDTPFGRNLPGGRVYTCLSHDIVAHETTHALLDGMRGNFFTPTNPEVPAFHEAFADLVAIFQHFTYPEAVAAALARSEGNLALDPLMATLARQFGQGAGQKGGKPLGLRTALELRRVVRDDFELLAGDRFELLARSEHRVGDGSDLAGESLRTPAGEEPHERGAVLVAAVFEAFAVVLGRRVRPFRRLVDRYRPAQGAPDPDLAALVAEQSCRTARQFLSLCIRAVDYCPPVDITFGDYLRALITADADLVPDDPHGYRDALINAFARRRLYPDRDEVTNLSEDALLWRAPRGVEPTIPALGFKVLKFEGDPGRAPRPEELRRQARAVFAYAVKGLDPGTGEPLPGVRHGGHYRECGLHPWAERCRPGGPDGDILGRPKVASIRSLRRIGPNREVRFELVAEVVQTRWHRFPDDGTMAPFLGGATLIVGPEGEVRYIVRKSVVPGAGDPDAARAAARDAARMAAFRGWVGRSRGDEHGGLWKEDKDQPGRLKAACDALRRLHGRRHAAVTGRPATGDGRTDRR